MDNTFSYKEYIEIISSFDFKEEFGITDPKLTKFSDPNDKELSLIHISEPTRPY